MASCFLLITLSIWRTSFSECPLWEGLPMKVRNSDGLRVDLTTAHNSDGAACLDGSVPVMYYRQGTGDGLNKFHVFFEGGGWCGGIDNQLSACQDTCVHRSTTDLGSSNHYPAAANFDNGYMSSDPNTNPMSHNWNTFYVKYCDGASFSGNNDTVDDSDSSVTLHWRGFRILNGVFKELANNPVYGWNETTDVLISGCSAGGLTTWLHSQYIYDSFVAPLGIKPSNFLSMPDSGFFLEWEGNGQYITAMKWLIEWQNTTAALNKECVANQKEREEWKCMLAQETAPYENIRMFPLQSRFDSWQAGCELGSKESHDINAYGKNLSTTFEEMYIKGKYSDLHGAFLDSCYHHCGMWNSFEINGQTASKAQYDFYHGNTQNAFFFQEEQYPCANCCKS